MSAAEPPNKTMVSAPIMLAASSEALHTFSTIVIGLNLVLLEY